MQRRLFGVVPGDGTATEAVDMHAPARKRKSARHSRANVRHNAGSSASEESIVMAEDTTFENFLNFSSFANSFEDVEFLDLRNVKDMEYIPMNLSKMISLKYLLLPNEFAPPPEEDFKDAAEAGVNYGKKIENEVHIFDIICLDVFCNASICAIKFKLLNENNKILQVPTCEVINSFLEIIILD